MKLLDLLVEDTQDVNEAGAGLSRIISHIQDGTPFIMMSAFRPNYSMKQNRERMKQLNSDLQRAGFGVIKLDGVWEGDSEPSFFAIPRNIELGGRMARKLSVHLGQKYEQDATIMGDGDMVYLLGQDGSEWETFDAATIDGDDLNRLPGQSRIKGKSFALVKSDDPETMATGNSRIDFGRN